MVRIDRTVNWTVMGLTAAGPLFGLLVATYGRPDDPVQLAASVMDWRHISRVPLKDDHGKLIGMVSHRTLLHLLAETDRALIIDQ